MSKISKTHPNALDFFQKQAAKAQEQLNKAAQDLGKAAAGVRQHVAEAGEKGKAAVDSMVQAGGGTLTALVSGGSAFEHANEAYNHGAGALGLGILSGVVKVGETIEQLQADGLRMLGQGLLGAAGSLDGRQFTYQEIASTNRASVAEKLAKMSATEQAKALASAQTALQDAIMAAGGTLYSDKKQLEAIGNVAMMVKSLGEGAWDALGIDLAARRILLASADKAIAHVGERGAVETADFVQNLGQSLINSHNSLNIGNDTDIDVLTK
jgi:hypothetical protein